MLGFGFDSRPTTHGAPALRAALETVHVAAGPWMFHSRGWVPRNNGHGFLKMALRRSLLCLCTRF